MDTRNTMLALDVEDIQHSPRGQKVINGLVSSKGGKLYRTARGRLAVQVTPDAYARIKDQLKITYEEGLDGTKELILQELPSVSK